MKKALLAATMMAALVGCASSHVLVGTQRAPIDPSQVQVYLDPPARFEKIALIESDSRGIPAFSPQRSTNAVVARMKAEAAQLGANGLLLQEMGSQSVGSVATVTGNSYGGASTGMAIGGNAMLKTGSALAIYVLPDAPQQSIPAEGSKPVAAPCQSCAKIGDGL